MHLRNHHYINLKRTSLQKNCIKLVIGKFNLILNVAVIVDKANDRGCLTERIRMERERERERGGVSSALVFSPPFRRAVPACCTELQGNTSPCISVLCTTYRSDCVGCSVGTAATVYTSFFSD